MYFFIDPKDVTTVGGTAQTNLADAFGPSTSTSFKVGTDFSLTTAPISGVKRAKAFACQNGFMLIQQSTINSDTVNIILKTDDSLGIDLPKVKYYIYRGIAIDSFLNGSTVIASDPDPSVNPKSLENFWTTKADLEAKGEVFPPVTNRSIGYLGGLSNTSIEDYWQSNTQNVRPIRVKEGDWIGDWRTLGFNKISFEIILENDNLPVDLDYCAHPWGTVDVSSFSGSPFELKLEREKVLAYIDPAAFFGMHYHVGIERFDSNIGQSVVVLDVDLYNEIIQIFATKNRLYINIRSERGYSYNFYDNYTDGTNNIQIKNNATSTFTSSNHNLLGWPIYYTDLGATTNGRFELQLRTDDNASPLLLIRNAKNIKRARVKKPFIQKAKLKRTPDTGWTKDIKLKSYTASNVFVANYIQFHYFRQEPSTVNTIPNISNDLDTYFGSIQLIPTGATFNNNQSLRLQLIEADNFSYAAYPGLYKDASRAIFITRLHNGSSKFSNQKTLERWPNGQVEGNGSDLIDSNDFPIGIAFNKTVIVENTAQGGNPPSYTATRHILDIANCDDQVVARREDFLVLALTAAQHDALLTAANALSTVHGQFIVFSPIGTIHRDVLGIRFKKYSLSVQGLDSTNGTAVPIALGTPIEVYSFNDRVFSSNDFATAANVPQTIPDPSSLKPWRYVGTAHYPSTTSPLGAAITIPDLGNNYGLDSPEIRLRAHVFFPADAPSKMAIVDISTDQTDYPLVVVVHGNGHNYKNYDKLLKYLAHNGFIAVSVDCSFEESTYIVTPTGNPNLFRFTINGSQYLYATGIVILSTTLTTSVGDYLIFKRNPSTGTWFWEITSGTPFSLDSTVAPTSVTRSTVVNYPYGMGGLGRAHVLFHHLNKIRTDFGSRVRNSIGLIGHSRGGEAILIAKRLIDTQDGSSVTPDLTSFNNISALFSLGPTDQYEVEKLGTILPAPRDTIP